MLRLTFYRQQRGWSKSRLAREAALNASTVGLIENKRLRPYATQMVKLATALGVPADEDLLAEVSEH